MAALAEIVVDRLRLGLDPGDALALERYAAWRRFDGWPWSRSPTASTGCSPTTLLPVRLAREAGLAVVERMPPLKRFFMQHAMGLVGDLPRAMRGQPL